MESLMVSLQVVAPLFVWMALGYGLRRLLGLDGVWVEKTNKLIFRLLLPLMLFRNTAQSNLAQEFTPALAKLAGFILAGVLITFIVLMLVVPRLEKTDARRGVIIQGIARSNTALYGIPVAATLFGQQALGTISLLIALVVPFYNAGCVLVLERYRGGRAGWGGILKKIATNPLIIAIALGALWSLTGLGLPEVLRTPLWGLADCATPLSFLALGASFSFRAAARDRRPLAVITAVKLVAAPLLWLGMGVLLGFRGVELGAVLVIFAPPTAISSFPMACAMGGDKELSSEIVVFTSAFSVITVFGWVWLLRALGLF